MPSLAEQVRRSKLAQEMTPKQKIRFHHVEGDLKGTYGGWDWDFVTSIWSRLL